MTEQPNTLSRVLIVEDDDDIRTIVRISLETFGKITVEDASSGKDALERIVAFRPNLILLDVLMADMNGPETMERIRAIPGCENIPIVFLTAKSFSHEIEEYKRQGVVDVITKPFDPLVLAPRIQNIWKHYLSNGAGEPA